MADTTQPEPREPQTECIETEAGRTLLHEHSSGTPHMARHIAAIETEAREQGRREGLAGLRAAAQAVVDREALPVAGKDDKGTPRIVGREWLLPEVAHLADVLARLAPQGRDTGEAGEP